MFRCNDVKRTDAYRLIKSILSCIIHIVCLLHVSATLVSIFITKDILQNLLEPMHKCKIVGVAETCSGYTM